MSDPSPPLPPFAISMVAGGSPHAVALGFETLQVDDTGAKMRLPYDLKLVGDPESGVLFGGAVTSLLDHCCGAAVHAAMSEFAMIATLDLRIDYMRPARKGAAVTAHAVCFRRTRSIAFVRALAYEDDPADPVAAAQAAFMLNSTTAATS
jgi:uncharacterized protein (TIGR00369 family)